MSYRPAQTEQTVSRGLDVARGEGAGLPEG